MTIRDFNQDQDDSKESEEPDDEYHSYPVADQLLLESKGMELGVAIHVVPEVEGPEPLSTDSIEEGVSNEIQGDSVKVAAYEMEMAALNFDIGITEGETEMVPTYAVLVWGWGPEGWDASSITTLEKMVRLVRGVFFNTPYRTNEKYWDVFPVKEGEDPPVLESVLED